MGRPVLETSPPPDAVGDVDIGGECVQIRARHGCLEQLGVELFPLTRLEEPVATDLEANKDLVRSFVAA
jgi:hypothetical protein